jgi:hypothetical protein
MLRVQHRVKAFEMRVPKRIFGPKRDEIKRDLRKLYNEELHKLHFSSHRVIKSRRMRRVGHVARMTIRGISAGFCWESQKETNHQEYVDVILRMKGKGKAIPVTGREGP